jgi:hypothetical protein
LFDPVATTIPDTIKPGSSGSSSSDSEKETDTKKGGLSKAPKTASWRKGSLGSVDDGFSILASSHGSPKNKAFTELDKTGQAPEKKTSRWDLSRPSVLGSHNWRALMVVLRTPHLEH